MKSTRLGIIGDVHAADAHLETALHFLRRLDLDAIVCVGDIADGPGSLEHCCQLLQGTRVTTVCGNHDLWFLNDQMRDLPVISSPTELSKNSRLFLASLPATVTLETSPGKLLLCHGTGTNDMHAVLPEDGAYDLENNTELQRILCSRQFRFMVCGHSHRRMVRHIEHLTIINPGPLVRMYPADDEAGIAVADFAEQTLQFYNFADADLVVAAAPVSLSYGE